jgi:hypothetical protein
MRHAILLLSDHNFAVIFSLKRLCDSITTLLCHEDDEKTAFLLKE